jgi:drug/metabolite transporter (DMT)-like permease
VVSVVMLYAGFNLVSRLGFVSSLRLQDMAALRFSVAGVIMLPVLFHYGLRGIRPLDIAGLVFFGGIGFALLAYTGLSMAPASHGGVLMHGSIPLFSFLLVRIVHRVETTTARAIGVGAIGVGIAIMIWDSLQASTPKQLFGDSALMLASACWAAYGLLAQRLGLKPAHSAAIVAVFSMCIFFPVYVLVADKGLTAAGWNTILFQGLFQGVLIGCVSVFLYTQAVALLGAIETSLFTAAIPCITTVSAIFLLGEFPSAYVVAGVAIVTLGMVVAVKFSTELQAA